MTSRVTYPPLTTTFTPPPECFTKWTVVSVTKLVTGVIAQDNKPPRNSKEASCYPSGVFSTLSYLYATFSPGICPSGYASTVQTVSDGVTTAICCMSGFTGTYGCTSSNTASTTALLLTDLSNTGPAPSIYTTVGPGVIYGQPINILYHERDFSVLPQLKPTTSTLSFSFGGEKASIATPTGAVLSSPTASILRPEAFNAVPANDVKPVAIIGGILGGLLLLAACLLALSKLRRNRRRGSTNSAGASVLNGLDHTGEALPNWPTEPKKLGRSGATPVIIGIFDFVMMISPLLFVVLAAFAKYFDGRVVNDDPRGNEVISVTRYGVTIYPILFAAVMGRAAEMTAAWIAERGGTIMLLEQLFGSTTLFGMLKTQFLLRVFNPLMILLLVLWSLSPLGGQGTLRLMSVEDRASSTPNTFWFLDTNGFSGASTVYYAPKSIGVQGTAVGSVYLSSLIAPDAVQNATQDLWGNIKIPRLEGLNTPADSNGWQAVPQHNVSYSSLVGIPVANIPDVGNSTLSILSSYYEFSCPDDPVLLPGSEEIQWFGNTTGKVRGSGQIVAGQGTFRNYGRTTGAVIAVLSI